MFDLYWRFLGLPLSRLKGAVSDAAPFSLVEASLWVAAAALVVLAASLARPRGILAHRGVRWTTVLLGPVFLIALGLGQGAFPLSIAPTGLREPLTKRVEVPPLDSAAFVAWTRAREERLGGYFGGETRWRAFQALSEKEVLRACDGSLDTVLAALGLLPGRTVRAFKDMGPWTSSLGLLYGGPAFHDPFFGEIGIIPDRNYPASHYWRLVAACHETAHAKGFTREMDAEILTQAALARLEDPRFTALADIHFLLKTGTKITWPDSLKAEARRVRNARARVEAARPALFRLKAWLRKADLQNSGAKYGERRAAEAWNPRHPFFATVRAVQEKL
ncbi:MAG: hypothetical protein K0Q91_1466 [Fibrobacteria bacterium]|nr:hypothetical protein [Fibrobacteria bacterium]